MTKEDSKNPLGKVKGLCFILLITSTALAEATEDYSKCFVPGEVSEYKASWMGIPVARSINTTEAFEENGRKLIRIRTVSKSYKAYAPIYKVNDLKEVIIDPKTSLPLRIDLHINAGNIKKSHLTLMDHANRTATFIDRIAGTTNQVTITSQTRDIITFLYAARNQTTEELTGQTHPLISSGKFYEMKVRVLKEDRIKIPNYGKIDCLKMEPIAEFDDAFLRKGELFFWISNDTQRMITRMKAKVPLGKVTIKLEHVSGSKNSFWDKTKADRSEGD